MRKASPTVAAEKSRCPACGSTRRTAYTNTRELETTGEHDGAPYTHVVWRNTRCKDCDQARIDKSWEHREPIASR